jgi:DMSO/TMAO reductase YedYZ molybdopterin-dependent catalytic subunit
MKRYIIPIAVTLVLLLTHPTWVNAQTKPEATVKISGEVSQPLTIGAAELQKAERVAVDRKDRDGKVHHYTGVLLSALLTQAGTTLGKDLRGENLTKYVLVEASDGYQIIFTLAELDTDFTDEKIILADQMDDRPLPLADGPFRIIVQNDKKPARCIKQVTSIKVGFAQ